MLINTTDYVPTYNIENPVYNAKFFWTEENIQKIVKKWRKNLVPALGYEVFLNKNRESKEAFYLSIRDMKFYELVVNQKAGKFLKKKEGKYTFETELYYFQSDDENLILQDINNEKNYDVLNLIFRNKLGKIVVVRLNQKYKTYQYQNKKWVEIATIDEYKF